MTFTNISNTQKNCYIFSKATLILSWNGRERGSEDKEKGVMTRRCELAGKENSTLTFKWVSSAN